MDTSVTRVLPPRGQWVPRVFHRAEAFYVIDLPEDEDLARHAELNPGTLMVTNMFGDILWRPQ
jgi:hypothetical protein